jgi:hypothetical protein
MPGIDARKTSSAAPASESANVVLLWLREGRGSYETDAAGIFPCRGNRPWTASSTQMSSSSSFQRKASPCRRSWTRSSWAWGALASKGYFVAGKLASRSSDNSSQMRRSSTQQRRAAIGEGALLSMKRNLNACRRLSNLQTGNPAQLVEIGARTFLSALAAGSRVTKNFRAPENVRCTPTTRMHTIKESKPIL